MAIDACDPLVVFLLQAVRQAGALARRIQAGMGLMNLTKSDLSPVTVADFAIQAITARALARTFPGEALVAEERSSELRSSEAMLATVTEFVRGAAPDANADSVCGWIDRGKADAVGRFWTLDPIDGTKGYLRGGQYAVALALVVDGRVELGALGCPNLDEACTLECCGAGAVLVAQRGGGAWCAPMDRPESISRLRVSDCRAPARARLLRSHEAAHTNTAQLDALVGRLGIQAEPVLMDSQAKYAVLAAGHAELLLRFLSPDKPDYREKIWDHAAGSLIVEESGGRVTDLDGKALDFTAGRALNRNRGLVASNGLLHDAALEAVRSV